MDRESLALLSLGLLEPYVPSYRGTEVFRPPFPLALASYQEDDKLKADERRDTEAVCKALVHMRIMHGCSHIEPDFLNYRNHHPFVIRNGRVSHLGGRRERCHVLFSSSLASKGVGGGGRPNQP